MKREILHGHGIQGMRVDLSIADMFAANQVADELKAVVENHYLIEKYKTTPYDQRKEAFPEGEPKRIEVSEKTLQNMHQLMLKLSYEVKSTLFDVNDEKEDRGNKTLIKDDPYAYPAGYVYDVMLLDVGQTKLQAVRAIKECCEFGLRESKELVDKAEFHPVRIITYSTEANAKKLADLLKEVGAIAEVVPHSI